MLLSAFLQGGIFSTRNCWSKFFFIWSWSDTTWQISIFLTYSLVYGLLTLWLCTIDPISVPGSLYMPLCHIMHGNMKLRKSPLLFRCYFHKALLFHAHHLHCLQFWPVPKLALIQLNTIWLLISPHKGVHGRPPLHDRVKTLACLVNPSSVTGLRCAQGLFISIE